VTVGFVVYWLIHDELHVLNIATALEERRRGVARALMEEAARRARAAGAVLATLEVRRSNASALALYRDLGYRQVGIRPNYYVDEGEDAIVMVLDL
jgi:ribosomal-protein-alanine N-acetyltransferase